MTRLLAAALTAIIVLPASAVAEGAASDEADDTADKKADESDEDKADKADKADNADNAGDKSAGDDEAAAKLGKASGRMTMPRGKVLINAIVEANLAKGAAGKPFSIAPDLWYGAGDKLTLGLVHSGRGATGFLAGAGHGLCFRGGGAAGACGAGLGDVYTFVGAEARYGLTEGGFALALALGLQARAFDPKLVLSAKVGLLGRWQAGAIAIELAPTVFPGLTQRKVDMGGVKVSNNEDGFGLPVTLLFKLSPAFAIAAQAGVTFIIEHAADTYQVPAALGLAWWVSPRFSVDVAFGLGAVVDKNDMTKAFDSRSLTLGVGYGM